MVGASGVGSFTEAHTTPCMFFDSMASSVTLFVKTKGDAGVLYRDFGTEKKIKKNSMKSKLVELKTSSFLDSYFTQRLSCGGGGCGASYSRKSNKCKKLHIVDELGGQYEEGFDDVKNEIINYLTYKAVRTVLNQLYEMNPPQYMWFHNFVADNVPNTGKRFLQTLAKEKLDLAERVMVTRLHLYGKWIKVCDHAEMYKEISDENLELMRERLLETIKWPADETDPDKMDS